MRRARAVGVRLDVGGARLRPARTRCCRRSSAPARFERLLADSERTGCAAIRSRGCCAATCAGPASSATRCRMRTLPPSAPPPADLRGLAVIDRAALTPAGRIAYTASPGSATSNGARTGGPRHGAADASAQPHRRAPLLPRPVLGPWRCALQDTGRLRQRPGAVDGFIVFLDRSLARVRAGRRRGVAQPRLVIEHLIVQFDTFIAQGVEGSVYRDPGRAFPETVPAADRERLSRADGEAIRDCSPPAFVRMRDGWQRRAAERAHQRRAVADAGRRGLLPIPRRAVHDHAIDAGREIHRIGLAELAIDRGDGSAALGKMGYPRYAASPEDRTAHHPRFLSGTAAALATATATSEARRPGLVPRLFGTCPGCRSRSAYTGAGEDERLPRLLQRSARTRAGPATSTSNTYDLQIPPQVGDGGADPARGRAGPPPPDRSAQEMKDVPEWRKFDGYTAYVEGWALYAESLGTRDGLLPGPLLEVRPAHLRDVAGGAAGGGHRHARQGLDARRRRSTTCRAERAARPSTTSWSRWTATSSAPARRWPTRSAS